MRRLWCTAVALAIVPLLASCTNSEPTRSDDVDAPGQSQDAVVAVVRDAAAATLEEGTAVADISGITQPGFVEGRASMDLRRPRADLELGAEIGIDSTVAVDGIDLYFDSNFFSNGTKVGRPWIKTTADELVEILGSEGLGLAESAQHPALLLYALAGIESAEEAGTSEVAGAEATRYDATVDLRKAAQVAPGEWREQIVDYATRLTSLGAGEVLELGVWIDSDGLVRKVDEAYEYDDEAFALPGRTGGSISPLHLTFEFLTFGVNPTLEVPRPSEVEPLDEYWERLLSEAGLDS